MNRAVPEPLAERLERPASTLCMVSKGDLRSPVCKSDAVGVETTRELESVHVAVHGQDDRTNPYLLPCHGRKRGPVLRPRMGQGRTGAFTRLEERDDGLIEADAEELVPVHDLFRDP